MVHYLTSGACGGNFANTPSRFYVLYRLNHMPNVSTDLSLSNFINRFNDIEREVYETADSNRVKLEAFRSLFRRDFYSFVSLLGYRDIGRFHIDEIERIGQVRFIELQPIRRLWLWSRGFFKTSLITEAHTVWLIINNHDISILIVSYTLDIAKKPLAAIRNHFTSSELFRGLFPEFCPKPNEEGKIEFGTTEALTVPNRVRPSKEPTIMCAGVGTNITGLHFDYMKIDDLVTRDSVTNDTQIQASKDYYSLLRPIFDNPTLPREDVIGTIYHFNDLHSQLLKNNEFSQSFIPVATDGVFTFPERIPKEEFENICNDPSINPYDVQSQYFLNPIDPAQRKFNDEWVRYYDELPSGLSEYVVCDPASSVKKKTDFTVIERWGIDNNDNWYLLDGIRDRLLANERVKSYVGVCLQAKRLKGAKYEVIGGRHGDLENICDSFIHHKLHLTPQETKSTNASKVDRIEQRLTGQFHAGKVFLPRQLKRTYAHDGKPYDFVQEYLLEYRQFPFSEHDDILDCHSQIFDGGTIEKGLSPQVVAREEDEGFSWLMKYTKEYSRPRRGKFVFGGRSTRRFEIPAQVSYR